MFLVRMLICVSHDLTSDVSVLLNMPACLHPVSTAPHCVQAGSSDSIADLLRLGSSAVSNGDEVAALHAHELQVSTLFN